MAEIATGGPGDESAAPLTPAVAAAPVQAATTRISVGGQEFDVPSALADNLRRDRDRLAGEYGSRLQAQDRRLAELESAVTSAEPEPQHPGQKPPDPRDLQYDPEKYHRDNLAYTNYLVASATGAVEQRRLDERQAEAAEGQRNRAWATQVDQFYREHPELKGDEDIVDTVWQRNFNHLARLPAEDWSKELASLASARIVAVAEKGKTLSKTVHLETSRGSRRAAPAAGEEADTPNVGGISAAIKAKQARFKMPYQKAS